jgi:hypothetical protein
MHVLIAVISPWLQAFFWLAGYVSEFLLKLMPLCNLPIFFSPPFCCLKFSRLGGLHIERQ